MKSSFHPAVNALKRRPTFSAAKNHWHLSEEIVFLNHGSFGACPRVVLEAQSRLRQEMEAAPLQFLARSYDERLDLARNSLAGFLGAAPGNLVFITNANRWFRISSHLHNSPDEYRYLADVLGEILATC